MSHLINLLEAPMRWMPTGTWSNPSQLMLVVMMFTLIGTLGLVRVLSGGASLTAPICFWVLFACGMAANRFLGPYRLPGTNELQHIIIYTTLGVALGSVVLLAALRPMAKNES